MFMVREQKVRKDHIIYIYIKHIFLNKPHKSKLHKKNSEHAEVKGSSLHICPQYAVSLPLLNNMHIKMM